MMKSIISFFSMVILVGVLMATTITSTPTTTEDHAVTINNENPLRTNHAGPGTRRILQYYPYWRPYFGTCGRNPNACRNPGSLGPDCCNNQCVNVKTDMFNCGRCGKRCWYNEICCEGKCVNPSYDKDHCGGCNNGCKVNGGYCMYGMCNYA